MSNCFLYNACSRIDCEKPFCLRKYKMTSLYDAALISETLRKHVILRLDADGTDLEQFKQLSEIEKNIGEFVDSGKNLYLHSVNTGNGKSSWSLRLIESYFNKIWARSDTRCRALFVSVPRFLLAMKENISNKNEYYNYIKDNILTADLVVWDDISHHTSSDFEITNLLSLIDTRLCEGKSNIYTSNIPPQALAQCLEARLASRIANTATVIELFGKDKRFLKLEDNK